MTNEERKVMEQALEALEESLPDVQKCLGNNLPHAGYARYDKRIAFYREQIAKHEAAITALRQCLQSDTDVEQQPSAQEQTTRLAHLDGVIPNAIRGYLRRCSSGGMPKKQIEIVKANVDEAERLGYFKLAIAQAMLAAAPEQQEK